MGWAQVSADVQDIVWDFCGDLRNPVYRRRRFVGTEVKVWRMIIGHPISPSGLLRHYGFVGVNNLKNTLELAYLQAQRESFLEYHRGSGTP